jgi:hypothetical protein
MVNYFAAVFTEVQLEAEQTGFHNNIKNRKPFTADCQINLKQHEFEHQ